jgi:uncharacterized protein (DUF2236 family)
MPGGDAAPQLSGGTGPIDGPRPGRRSLTWRCAADSRALLLAPSALLLQVAHPVVGAGVAAHSNFRAAPWTRLIRTMRSVDRIVFGPEDIAVAEGRRLLRVHAGIRGVDDAGRAYHGLDPAAYAWVHLTLVQLFVDVQRLFGPPLTPSEEQVLYLEWRRVGRLLRIRDEHLPPTWADYRCYFERTVERVLESNRAVEDVLAAVARPKKPGSLIPGRAWDPLAERAGHLVLLLSVGALPPSLRPRIGVPWTAADDERFEHQVRRLRALFAVVPQPLLHVSPVMPYLVRARLWTPFAGRRPPAGGSQLTADG